MTAPDPARREEMRRLRAAGLTLVEIGARLGVSRQRVAQVLGPDGRWPKLVIPPDMVAAYQSGEIIGVEIARRLGVHRKTVYAALRRQGIRMRRQLPPPRKRPWIVVPADLAAAYRAGELTGVQIARHLGVAPRTVYAALRRQGVAVRPPGG